MQESMIEMVKKHIISSGEETGTEKPPLVYLAVEEGGDSVIFVTVNPLWVIVPFVL